MSGKGDFKSSATSQRQAQQDHGRTGVAQFRYGDARSVDPRHHGCTFEIVIREYDWYSKDPEVARISRTAPPVIVELWETIPAETRRQLEAGFRNWQPPARRSMIEFLNHAVFLLESFRPVLKRGRLPAIERHFAQRVAGIWRDL